MEFRRRKIHGPEKKSAITRRDPADSVKHIPDYMNGLIEQGF